MTKSALMKSRLAPESINSVALTPLTQVVMVKSFWELSPEAAELRVRMGTEGWAGSGLKRGAEGCECPEQQADEWDERRESRDQGSGLAVGVAVRGSGQGG